MAQVYKFTSPSNKIYIGMTKNTMMERWKQHISLWKRQKQRGQKYTHILFHAFDKYTPESFTKEILFESNDIEEIKQKEIYFIALYQSTNSEFGYNIQAGGYDGNRNRPLSTEHKKKQSDARKAYFLTPEGIEWKETLRKNRIEYNENRRGKPGKPHSEATKQLLSKIVKEAYTNGTRDSSYSKLPKTEETKKKISEAKRGKPAHPNTIKNGKWSVTKETGESFEIIGLESFAREIDLPISSLKNTMDSNRFYRGYNVQRIGNELI